MPGVSLEEHRAAPVVTCSFVKIDGRTVILCGKGKIQACHVCQAIASKLCDWKIAGGTCDAPMCEEHAHEVGQNRDLCFRHMNAWKMHSANRQLRLPL